MGRAQEHRGEREDERRMRNATGKYVVDSEVERWEKNVEGYHVKRCGRGGEETSV